MAFKLRDNVAEISTTTGSGDIDLAGAVTGYNSFGSFLSAGDTTWAQIRNVDVPSEWLSAVVEYVTGNDLDVVAILDGTNGAGNAVSFSAGVKQVVCGLPAIAMANAWALQPIGVPVPLMSSISGAAAPPKDQGYRYVLLTAGETGSGEYNQGILTSESVSGSAPLVQATAVLDLDGSPMDGQTIRLINTERRFLRAGSAGTVQNDQMQQITGTLSRLGANRAMFNGGSGALTAPAGSEFATPSGDSVTVPYNGNVAFNSANSPDARAGTETRPKNIGVNYYMRVL